MEQNPNASTIISSLGLGKSNKYDLYLTMLNTTQYNQDFITLDDVLAMKPDGETKTIAEKYNQGLLNAVKNADRYWARLVDENGATVKTRECAKALVSFTGLTPGKTYYVQLQARVPKSSGGYQYSGYCDPIGTPITMPLA